MSDLFHPLNAMFPPDKKKHRETSAIHPIGEKTTHKWQKTPPRESRTIAFNNEENGGRPTQTRSMLTPKKCP